MAFKAVAVTVGTFPTRLVTAQPGDVEIVVKSTATVLVGGREVSEMTGMWVGAVCGGGEFRTEIRPGDELWAVAPAVTDVRVLVRSA